MANLIDKLIDEIGPGHMGSTAYDTAWAARLGEIDWDLSSHALAWLAENQLDDGAWGASVPMYYHDRVLCTLAAMIALSYRGPAWARQGSDRKRKVRSRAHGQQGNRGADGRSERGHRRLRDDRSYTGCRGRRKWALSNDRGTASWDVYPGSAPRSSPFSGTI